MIVYLKEAENDVRKLSKKDRLLYAEQISKLEKNAYLGKSLSSNLSDCRKIYFGSKSELRIIYTIKKSQVCILVAIGCRNDLEVYQLAAERLNRKWK